MTKKQSTKKAAGNRPAAKGVVYLVGAGPGDPRLITLRGLECLRECDTVIYDYLAHPSLLEAVPEKAERIYVGKQAGRHTMKQADINRLLVERAGRGERIVRLKGGDPYIFGRGAEEALELEAAGVAFEIIPGVTAAAGAAAYAGVPLTHRDYASSVSLITGHEDPTQKESDIPWEMLAKAGGTLVFYMGVGRLEELIAQLIANGRSRRCGAAVVEWATLPRQRTVIGTVGTIVARARKAGVKPPALLIIGDGSQLRSQLNWFESRPLFGKRILVTRARHQASVLQKRLVDLGAEAVEFPTIRIAPPRSERRLREVARRVADYDWVVFTSANAVDRFIDTVIEEGGDVRAFGHACIAAIGPATRAAVERYHLAVALQPEEYVAESVVKAFKSVGKLAGTRILLPRAAEAREVLPEGLREAGAQVDVVAAYRTVAETPPNRREIVADLAAGRIDLVTFTSSSTVTNFVRAVGRRRIEKIAKATRFASIGPITSKTMRENGLRPAVTAKEYTIEGLVDAIQSRYGKKSPRRKAKR